ncbi:metalloprotease PmbA [Granulosicoccaceae sp. 1_MG-2023]|nr:metalloprotease PmbA [Granulosicoccaceae sp. 1_MG-2023]
MADIAPASLAPQRQQLERLAALALESAKQSGADSAELAASLDEGLSVRVRNGQPDTVEHNRDKSFGITVYRGKSKGSASTTDFSESAIRETVARACAIARYTSEDPCAGLADADLMATDLPDLDLYHPWQISAEEAIDKACEMEQAAFDADSRVSKPGGANVGRHEGISVYANSHGFCGIVPSSRHSLSCSMIAGEGSTMQRDHHYSVSRLPSELDSPASVGAEAARRAVLRLGAKPVKTGVYPVLFDPSMARSLLQHFVSAVSGSALYRRSSFLLDKAGEPVFCPAVTLREEPLIPRALGSSAFDRDGLARRPRTLVDAGVLQGYVLGSYSARKLGLPSTANAGGVRNLILTPGEQDLPQLMKTMGTGLLVTEMMGQGVRLTTGDYSRGAAGLWIENGQISHAVQEITVAGNLASMYQNIAAIGADTDIRGNIRTPSILIREMTIAGQ